MVGQVVAVVASPHRHLPHHPPHLQPAFAVGALAGATTRSGTVCGIYGVPFQALQKFRNGFAEGVAHACPACRVESQYVYSFGDLAYGAEVCASWCVFSRRGASRSLARHHTKIWNALPRPAPRLPSSS